MEESFRSSIFMGAHLEHRDCAGGSEQRSAAPVIQGGGQATRCGLPLINAVSYIDERLSSRLVGDGKCPSKLLLTADRSAGRAIPNAAIGGSGAKLSAGSTGRADRR
jgi:hypothetical protein